MKDEGGRWIGKIEEAGHSLFGLVAGGRQSGLCNRNFWILPVAVFGSSPK